LPTALDASARAARAAQITKQKRAGGYMGQTLLGQAGTAQAPSAPKTLLGG
jgi:hypothetical protein